MKTTPFDIPEEMRNTAEKSVEQARKAFDEIVDATQKAVAQAEGSAQSLRESTADLNRQAWAFLEENVTSSFDLAARLARARTVEEVAAIQQEFISRQTRNLADQGRSLGEMASRAASATMDSIKRK